MATTSITLTHGRASDLQVRTGDPARTVLHKVVRLLEGGMTGAYVGATGFVLGTDEASGTLTLSSASGAVGGTINGVSVTVTASGGDTATATALAEAINASGNALVNEHVSATSAAGVVTLTAKTAGPGGNAVTLAASGTGVTASGARLTGGTSTSYTF